MVAVCLTFEGMLDAGFVHLNHNAIMMMVHYQQAVMLYWLYDFVHLALRFYS